MCGKVRPSDLLASAIESGDAKILATLTQALVQGSTPLDLRDVIEVYNSARSTPTDFDGKRDRFSPEMLEALDPANLSLQQIHEFIAEICRVNQQNAYLMEFAGKAV